MHGNYLHSVKFEVSSAALLNIKASKDVKLYHEVSTSDIFNKHRAFNFTKNQLLVGLLDPDDKGTAFSLKYWELLTHRHSTTSHKI